MSKVNGRIPQNHHFWDSNTIFAASIFVAQVKDESLNKLRECLGVLKRLFWKGHIFG